MRSGVFIGAAIGALTVRLLAGHGDGGPEARPAPASGAVARLAGMAASAPWIAGQDAASAPPAPAVSPVRHPAVATAGLASRAASAGHAMRAASVESEVRAQRARGDGEDAVYRTRAAHLPADEVAQLMARETAEAAWQRQLAGCRDNCAAASPEPVAASAYRREMSPRLTLE